MKPFLLICVLAILFMKISAQEYPIPGYNENRNSAFPEIPMDSSLLADLLREPEKLHINPANIPHIESRRFLTPPRRLPDRMPVIRPRGPFHGIEIRPMPGIDYKLKIVNPDCPRFTPWIK